MDVRSGSVNIYIYIYIYIRIGLSLVWVCRKLRGALFLSGVRHDNSCLFPAVQRKGDSTYNNSIVQGAEQRGNLLKILYVCAATHNHVVMIMWWVYMLFFFCVPRACCKGNVYAVRACVCEYSCRMQQRSIVQHVLEADRRRISRHLREEI